MNGRKQHHEIEYGIATKMILMAKLLNANFPPFKFAGLTTREWSTWRGG